MSQPAATVSVDVGAGARTRLDRFLAERGEWGTRSQVQRLIEQQRVCVNGKGAKGGTMVKAGDVVSVSTPSEPVEVTAAEPENIPLDVLYEDETLLAINKPAGLVVHPAPGNWRGTLVSALLHRWRGADAGLDRLRPGIVHRLDRDTSGVLVIAKNADTVARLQSQFRARTVKKEYLALVWRCPRPPVGVIDRPIGRHPVQRKRMSIRTGGRAAVTRYEVIESFGDVALLRLHPETGRTHQIRVHLAAIGHPVVGDVVYGRKRPGVDPRLAALRRHALHAAVIEIRHPRSGASLSIHAPEPADLLEVIAHLRARSARR